MTDKKNNTGSYNTGSWNTGSWNTGYGNTGYYNTSDYNTGDYNTGNWNTGNWNTGSYNTGSYNTGSWNTGSYNTGSWNTGSYNTGSYNTGYCNTITPNEVLMFNKMGKRENWHNAEKPNWMLVDLTQWIPEPEMTNKEKEAYPSYTTTGGYLKCYSSLKAAYVEAWERADKEDRDKTYELPNFDPVVFEEIFGFNPCDCVEEKREHTPINCDIIEINGVKYKRL